MNEQGTENRCSDERIKLFLVDDHQVLRQALAEALSHRQEFSVVAEAADGAELLARLSEAAPDVILLDLAMPRFDGLSTIEELKRRGVDVPVLVLSADESERSIRSAINAGARGFLPKQSDMREVEFAIHSVLEGKTYLSPAVTEQIMGSHGQQPDGCARLVASLSSREHEVFMLLVNGCRNREISEQLKISPRTVDTHRSNILKKLEVKSNAELVKVAIAAGELSV
jgi:DNA-binding NarL/FixJ family response regulator